MRTLTKFMAKVVADVTKRTAGVTKRTVAALKQPRFLDVAQTCCGLIQTIFLIWAARGH